MQNNIIYWNCNGFHSHKNEIDIILSEYEPVLFCVQETKFNFKFKPKLNSYNVNYTNQRSDTVSKGGVATFIKEGYSFEEVEIDSPLQVVVTKIFYPLKFTICNLYIPPSFHVTYN